MNPEKQLVKPKQATTLFWTCWLAYFAAYLGRLNYAATMAEIIRAEGYRQGQGGLVATAFFITYGIGQVINGILGDKFSPRNMIFIGLTVSAGMNFGMGFSSSPKQMIIVWCINGFAQSMIWPPMLRLLSSWLPAENRRKAYLNITSTYAVGTLIIYLFSSIMIRFAGWRVIYYVVTIVLLLIAGHWFLQISRLDKQREIVPEKPIVMGENSPISQNISTMVRPPAVAVICMLVFLGIALISQGVLKDGVMTWVPSYITGTFETSTSFSILLTMLLPLANLVGVYGIDFLRSKLRLDEMVNSILLFAVAALSMLGLYVFGSQHISLTLLFFAITTTCMLGINTLAVNFIPSYFAPYGRVSTVSGFLNFSVYIGSAISAYGIGAIAESAGWSKTILGLFFSAVLGIVFTAIALPFWKKFMGTRRR